MPADTYHDDIRIEFSCQERGCKPRLPGRELPVWDAMPKMTMPEIFKSVLCKRAYRQKPGQSAGGGPLPPSAFRAILSDFGRFCGRLWGILKY